MNLQFGICWIEDQASEAEVEAVQGGVRGSGFEPLIDRIETEEQIRDFAKRQDHFQDYDLILLDLRLGGGLRGDDLAPRVRSMFRSTPILFYSAQDETELRGMMAQKLVEGVYCVHRDRLSTRVGELVADLSPALNRLSTMRGLSARVVAECDQELRTMLLALGRRGHADDIAEALREKVKNVLSDQLAQVASIVGLSDLLANHAVSSGPLWFVLQDEVRRHAKSDEARDLLRRLKEYPNQVLKRRNTLAHALEERTADGWRITRKGAPTLSVDDFQRYRRDFLLRLEDLRNLRALLVCDEAGEGLADGLS